MAQKKRGELDKAFQWNLSPIYENRAAWERDLQKAQQAVGEIAALPGTLKTSKEALKAGLDAIYRASALVERVYVYAMLQKAGDNGDSDYQEMEGKATTLSVSFGTACAFVDPEILSIPASTLKSWTESEELASYRHILEDTARSADHTLSREQEEMLAALSDAAGTPDQCFTMLESVDMTFPEITDETGKKVPLTHGSYGVYRDSRVQSVRKEAFEVYFGEFKRYLNTFAAMYAGSVKLDCYYARMRQFSSACERALFSGNVPLRVYDALVEAVHRNLPAMHRYLDLRRETLGLDELHMYDLYCPMVEDVEFNITYPQAQQMVKQALAPLGERYEKLLDRAFSERWIDVYENSGKTTGAFSCGVYGVHPYVLLNFTGTLDDAFTLAHELGHAMHSFFSDETQDYPNHDYRILVAEVASTVNEVLLTKYLLKTETDPARRAYVLNHFLEGFRTTVYRQTLFAEFERQAHDLYQQGQPLTAKVLSDVYRKLNEEYYAGAVVDALQDIEWARIPHFYNAFYVYQYATGFSSAVAIAEHILTTGDTAGYLKFLTTGGSDYPIEELKLAGVDLTDPKTVSGALGVFRSSLDEMAQLLKTL
ncbi:MAG: oligoendopeptidase F [Oscillibacter sp.]|jgi:oligoendopeptidase F|nr:oligoendopeptidase F [Oscillibacter sp.]